MPKEKKCPHCDIDWEEEKNIYEFFLKQYQDKEKASNAAKSYGCTKENPISFGKNVIGIEIEGQYDGVSQWECQSCKTIFDRFTMKKIS